MQEKNTANLKDQRLKKMRVGRMKKAIMMTIGVWMAVSMLLCIGLLLKIIKMDQKIDELAANAISVQQVADADKNLQSAAEPRDMQSQNVDEEHYDGGDAAEAMTAAGAEGEDSQGENQTEEKKKVYLTFDDGPSENTDQILDILKEKGVKATFFVIGNEDENAKAMYQRIVAEGHTLGMHSYSHKYSMIYESLDAFKEDMTRLRTYLYEMTGVKPNIVRFPGGSSNQVSNTDMSEFIRYLNGEGIRYYDWNVASGDATSQAYTPDELVENVMKDVVRFHTSIVLMHDSSTKGTTVDALGPMIDQLKAMDVDLLPIDENTKLIQHIPADSVS